MEYGTGFGYRENFISTKYITMCGVIFFVKVLDDLRKVSIFIPMRHEAAFEFKNHSFRRWPLNICP